jgi:hypothetical protein
VTHEILLLTYLSIGPQTAMYTWLCPFDASSFQSAKKKVEIIHDIASISSLGHYWNDKLFIFRKGMARNCYFPVARVVVKATGDTSLVEIRYICPLFYGFVVLCALVEFSLIKDHAGVATVLFPLGWCLGHAIGCLAFQVDKESLEAQIRTVLLSSQCATGFGSQEEVFDPEELALKNHGGQTP